MKLAFTPLLLLGCSFQPGDAAPPDAAATFTDDIPDEAQFGSGAFGAAQRVSVSSADRDDDVTLTADMLEMYFERQDAMGKSDVYWSHRDGLEQEWSTPVKVQELSSPASDGSLHVSGDGLTMFLSSTRGTTMNFDIYVSTRPRRDVAWSEPVMVPALSHPDYNDWDAQVWSDTVLILGSNRRGDPDVFRSTRTSPDKPWGTPVVIEGLHSEFEETEAFEDAQGAIWFTGNMGADGSYDIWYSKPGSNGQYEELAPVAELSTAKAETDPWLSPDGHTLYFTSDREGSLDIYVATR